MLSGIASGGNKELGKKRPVICEQTTARQMVALNQIADSLTVLEKVLPRATKSRESRRGDSGGIEKDRLEDLRPIQATI
jgi:hypothetical protein